LFGFPVQPERLSVSAFLLRCPTSAFGGKAPWHLSTAATRSPHFSCHWQRSGRSPPSRLLLETFLADQEKSPSGGCNATNSSAVIKKRNCPLSDRPGDRFLQFTFLTQSGHSTNYPQDRKVLRVICVGQPPKRRFWGGAPYFVMVNSSSTLSVCAAEMVSFALPGFPVVLM